MQSKKLFGSQARVDILKLFFTGNPELEMHAREIYRRTSYSQFHGIRRELWNLTDLGILKARSSGVKKMFKLNLDNPKVEHLRQVIL